MNKIACLLLGEEAIATLCFAAAAALRRKPPVARPRGRVPPSPRTRLCTFCTASASPCAPFAHAPFAVHASISLA